MSSLGFAYVFFRWCLRHLKMWAFVGLQFLKIHDLKPTQNPQTIPSKRNIFQGFEALGAAFPRPSMYGIFTIIYLHLVDLYGKWGKCASPMDGMGFKRPLFIFQAFLFNGRFPILWRSFTEATFGTFFFGFLDWNPGGFLLSRNLYMSWLTLFFGNIYMYIYIYIIFNTYVLYIYIFMYVCTYSQDIPSWLTIPHVLFWGPWRMWTWHSALLELLWTSFLEHQTCQRAQLRLQSVRGDWLTQLHLNSFPCFAEGLVALI